MMTGRAALKSRLREHYLARRQLLSINQRRQQQQQVLQLILQSKIYKQSQNIAIYLPFAGEFDPSHIIRAALNEDKHCYAPVITNKHHGEMVFQPITQAENDFDILQQHAASTDFDLMIIPLVAFDLQKNRLGMGGGFYDRFLAQIDRENSPFCLGVAYQEQRAEQIPIDSWDQPLDAIVTASGFV